MQLQHGRGGQARCHSVGVHTLDMLRLQLCQADRANLWTSVAGKNVSVPSPSALPKIEDPAVKPLVEKLINRRAFIRNECAVLLCFQGLSELCSDIGTAGSVDVLALSFAAV